MEPQISAAHEVDDQVPVTVSLVQGTRRDFLAYMYSMSWKLYRKLQMNGWFTCSSILLSRIMLRTLSERTTNGGIKSAFFLSLRHRGVRGGVPPSSFRMYLRANDKFVSFLSTIRTLPKAPRPTTLRRRKWLRFTVEKAKAVLVGLSSATGRAAEPAARTYLRRRIRQAFLGCSPWPRLFDIFPDCQR